MPQELSEKFKRALAGYLSNPGRDYLEDETHENGVYMNICVRCTQTFRGHKRRVRCLLCNAAFHAETPSEICP